MKIKLLTAAIVLTLVSCNEPKQEDNIPTSKVELLTSLEDTEEDTAKKVTETNTDANEHATSAPARIISKPILIARGSEPGWYAEFYADHVSMLLDYGKDTISIDHDFSNINTDKTYAAKVVSLSNNDGKKTSSTLEVNVESKACTEASGDKKTKSIVVKYNNKEYKGCAY